jgi:gamma-glutamylputrescine oxidase
VPDYPPSFSASIRALPEPRPALHGKLRAQFAVIGAGFTGCSAALTLAERGKDVVLVEAARVGCRASGRNGGQIHSGYNVSQDELERRFGAGRARALWALAERAKRLLRERIATRAIACDLHDGILLAAHDRNAARDLAAKARHLNESYGYTAARFLSRDETRARIGSGVYHGALLDDDGGHLDPLALVIGLARAAEDSGTIIHETTRALRVEPRGRSVAVRCESGEILADCAILAGDAAMPEIAPALAPYLANIESYAVATAPIVADDALPGGDAVADTRRALDYYKMAPGRRLVFAGGETTLRKVCGRDAIASIVRPRLERVFPQLVGVPITHGWSGTVAITRTRLPHFGRLAQNILFGYGYSGQGVALGPYGGKVLADTALGEDSEFALLQSLPAKSYPFGRILRQPLTAAMVLALRISDAL